MSKSHSARTLGATALSLLAAVAFVSLAQAATPNWSYKTTGVEFQRVTSLGTLLLSHAGGLVALDPATGKPLWERPDLKKFKECNLDVIENTPYVLIDGKQFEVLDLATGQKKWDSSQLPFKNSLGQIQVPSKRLLIVFGLGKGGAKPMAVALDTETGEIKWSQDKFFDKPLKLYEVNGSGKVFKRFSIDGNQPAAFPDDDSIVLWLTEDGPIGVDLTTGARKWVCAGLKGKAPAGLTDGFCSMWARDGAIYVPYEKSLQAIDAKTGALLWAKEKDFRGRPVQMGWADAGLVVRGAPYQEEDKVKGKPFIDCLDPKTGVSVWSKPFKDLDDATSFDMKGDNLYICADNEMHQVSLAKGSDQILAKFKFKEHETPSTLELLDDGGYLLTSNQSLLKLDASGKELMKAYYEAPSISGWLKAGVGLLTAAVNAAAAGSAYDRARATGESQTYYLTANPTLGKRFRATQESAKYMYILTSVEDSGKKKAGIARVDRATGKAISTVQLGDKTPRYEVDEYEGILYFLSEDDIVQAYKM